MYKRIWFLLGILTGVLLTELWRRQHLERMHHAEDMLDEQRQRSIQTIKEIEAMDAKRSTEERIKYAIWDALHSDDDLEDSYETEE